MRFILALGLLLALSASASAAKLHHAKPPRHLSASVRESRDMVPQFAVPPVGYDRPGINDPSKFGGGAP